MSKEAYRDDPDSRIANMDIKLDESENGIKEACNLLMDNLILPFVESKDWSMIAEWNANSILGAFHRHNEMCKESLSKTQEQSRQALRDDTGVEISKNRLAGLVFRNEVQSLNVKRSELIFGTLNDKYKDIFGKEYNPNARGKSATDSKDVDTAEKQMHKDRLKKMVG